MTCCHSSWYDARCIQYSKGIHFLSTRQWNYLGLECPLLYVSTPLRVPCAQGQREASKLTLSTQVRLQMHDQQSIESIECKLAIWVLDTAADARKIKVYGPPSQEFHFQDERSCKLSRKAVAWKARLHRLKPLSQTTQHLNQDNSESLGRIWHSSLIST